MPFVEYYGEARRNPTRRPRSADYIPGLFLGCAAPEYLFYWISQTV